MNYLAKLKQCAIPVVCMYLLTSIFMFCGVISFNKDLFIAFTIGSLLLVLGQVLFLIGAENSLITMGKRVGSNLFKLKKLWTVLLIAFIFVFCTTIAEPDISLYIQKLLSLNSNLSAIIVLFIVGIGVGCFAVLGLYRIIKDIPFKYIVLILFTILTVLMCFSTNDFIGISIDGVGITSGPITAPFLLALSVGISTSRTSDSNENSFGLISISSIGASILLLILGFFISGQTSNNTIVVTQFNFWSELLNNMKDVGIILLPISLFFLILQKTLIKMSKVALQKIIAGIFITFFGLVIFLTGITYGFSAMGYFIGVEFASFLATSGNYFIIILFAFILGFILIFTEPSLKIFAKQVESVTSGNLKSNVVLITVGVGVAISVVLSFLVVLFDIPLIFIIIPVLLLILILSFVLPETLTAIAFDSGGLACGTIVPSFIIPICIGLGSYIQNSSLLGCAGIISFLPILIFQLISLLYIYKQNINENKEKKLYTKLNKVMLKQESKIKSKKENKNGN